MLLGVLAWRTGALSRFRTMVAGLGEEPVTATATPVTTDAWDPATGGWGATRGDGGDRMT
jgi:hypothetical protein